MKELPGDANETPVRDQRSIGQNPDMTKVFFGVLPVPTDVQAAALRKGYPLSR